MHILGLNFNMSMISSRVKAYLPCKRATKSYLIDTCIDARINTWLYTHAHQAPLTNLSKIPNFTVKKHLPHELGALQAR